MINPISVPDPCGENWDGMPQQGNGRYCGSCNKVVVDFTNKSTEEILDYFQEQAGNKVCGTFRPAQVISPDPFVKNKALVRFLAAALLAFGMSLFSCQSVDLGDLPPAPPEQLTGIVIAPPPVLGAIDCRSHPHGNLPAFTAPVITDDTTENHSTVTGEPSFKDTLKTAKQDTVVQFCDKMPEYGGPGTLQEYISNSIIYPKVAIDSSLQGTVYITFIVRKNGTLSDVTILKGISPELDAEALRVVKSIPPWKPGKDHNGQRVNVRFYLPIRFR
jgi:TonB family protein